LATWSRRALLVDEDALAIEMPNGKPRGLEAAVVAEVVGRLDAKDVAACV
jgi:hypothetical protein